MGIVAEAEADPEGKRRSLARKSKSLSGNGKKASRASRRRSKSRRQRKGAKKSNNKRKMRRRRKKDGKRKKSIRLGKKASKGKSKSRRRSRARAGRQNQSPVNTSCLAKAVKTMKMWKDVVRNFEAQVTRIRKQNKTGGNKAGKKGLFAPIARRLVEVGGGNKSSLSCGGGTMTNLTNT